MRSSVGWIELAPDALRQLQHELEGNQEGVVDEIGVGALHAGYADRLFPGTSLLHTRPRYLFFTAWNYLQLAKKGVPCGDIGEQKDKAELWVTRQLIERGTSSAESQGIIGGKVYVEAKRQPAQPVDMRYWTALVVFGIYHGPARSTLVREWDPNRIERVASRGPAGDDDLSDDALARFDVPPPPHRWLGRGHRDLSLNLQRDEAELLRTKLTNLDPPCVLSEAARKLRKRLSASAAAPWEEPLLVEAAQALGERGVLERARCASPLAKLTRAIYAALVERMKESDLARGVRAAAPSPRSYLDEVSRIFREERRDVRDAIALDLDALRGDIAISARLYDLLAHVQAQCDRVRRQGDVARHLLDDQTLERFAAVEVARKGSRARLAPTPAGRDLRREATKIAVVGLNYRFRVVARMLRDVREGLSR